MKWFKRLLLLLIFIPLFVISAMLAVVIFVDPNDYKNEIAAFIEQQTGRKPTIEDDIQLSLLPWLGLELGRVSLANPDGFTDPQFITAEKINLKIALLPLLKLETQIGKIQLIGLQVHLERLANERTNWEDLLPDDTSPSSPQNTDAQQSALDPNAQQLLNNLYIGGIDIRDASLIWRDGSTANTLKIEHIDLRTDAIAFNTPVDFEGRFALRNQTPKLIAGSDFSGTLTLDPTLQKFSLDSLALELKISGVSVPGNAQTIKLTIDSIHANIAQQLLQLNQFATEIAGLRLQINLAANDFLSDALTLTGDISAKTAELRQVMQQLDFTAPATSDPAVLQTLDFSSSFTSDADTVALPDIQATLDDTSIAGQISINLEPLSYNAQLSIDRLNADRYLPPAPAESATDPAATAAASGSAQQAAGEQAVVTADPIIDLPVDMLRQLKLNAELNIGELQAYNLQMQQLYAKVSANKGLVQIDPLRIQLYSGRFSGTASLDVTGATPKYRTTLDLDTVNAGDLLADYLQKRWLEGVFSMDAELSTSATRQSHLLQKLNGQFALAFTDGALSLNVRQQLNELKAKYRAKKPSQSLGEPTKFSSITASGNIRNGTVYNNDLDVRARHVYVSGKGQYQLPTDMIDYVLTILLSDDGATQDSDLTNLYNFPIEYPLKGKLSELDFQRIGIRAIGRTLEKKLKNAAEEEVRRQAEQAKRELEQKLQREQEALRREIEQRKQAEQAELERKLKKEVEDKKRKFLKDLFD